MTSETTAYNNGEPAQTAILTAKHQPEGGE